jgi:hypothetical protein
VPAQTTRCQNLVVRCTLDEVLQSQLGCIHVVQALHCTINGSRDPGGMLAKFVSIDAASSIPEGREQGSHLWLLREQVVEHPDHETHLLLFLLHIENNSQQFGDSFLKHVDTVCASTQRWTCVHCLEEI